MIETIEASQAKTWERTTEIRAMVVQGFGVFGIEQAWVCCETGEIEWKRVPEVVTQEDGTRFTRSYG